VESAASRRGSSWPRRDSLDDGRSSQPNSEDRLDSGKAIASYLKRDVRTVQRGEAVAGLPIHPLRVD
jgi:hypothetical protein